MEYWELDTFMGALKSESLLGLVRLDLNGKTYAKLKE